MSGFNCGEREINEWAKTEAHHLHANFRRKVYVATEVNGEAVLGFYCLGLHFGDQKKLLTSVDRDRWHLGAPLLYLDYVAVVRSMQKQGLGRLLLMHVMERARTLSDIAPIYGLALRSLNARTFAYYRNLGFAVAPNEDHAVNPLMILPIQTIQDLHFPQPQ